MLVAAANRLTALSNSLVGTDFSPLEFCSALPKAEPHLHGGAMAPLDVAARVALRRADELGRKLQYGGQTLSSGDDLQRLFRRPQTHPGERTLTYYLDRYAAVSPYLFTTATDIEEVSYEGAMDASRRGVAIYEVRTSIKSGVVADSQYAPGNASAGFGPEEEFRAMIRGFERARKDSQNNIRTTIIICLRRDDTDIDKALKIVAEAHRLRLMLQEEMGVDYIRGIDIAGNENGHRLKFFKPAFEYARKLGFRCFTAHAGESINEGGINQALYNLWIGFDSQGQGRLGHATALRGLWHLLRPRFRAEKGGHDKHPLASVVALGVPVETCLSSNWVCGATVTSGYAVGPNPEMKGAHRHSGLPALGRNADGQWIYPLTRPIHHLRSYPFRSLMALGGMSLIATDGVFTLDTNLAKEYLLAADVFELGAKELLCLSYYSIYHSFAPAEIKDDVINNQWIPFARLFFNDPHYSGDTVGEMNDHLAAWRQRLRRTLKIPDAVMSDLEELRAELQKLKKP